MTAGLAFLRAHKCIRRWLIGVVIAVVLYTLIGFLILPWIGRSVLQSQLTEALGRSVTIESVSFNPYTLVLEVEKFSISEAGSTERFVGFDLLHVNLSISSLFRLALVITDLQIVKPYVQVEQRAGGRFNFSDIPERLAKTPAEPAAGPEPKTAQEPGTEAEEGSQPVVLYNLQIQGGDFRFIDTPKNVRHTLDQFDLNLPLVSMRADDRGEFIQPSVRARLNGRQLELKGRTKPFLDTLESEFDFELSALDLVPLWEYIPLKPKPILESGTFTCKLALTFRQAAQPELIISGRLSIDKLSLSGGANDPLLSFDTLAVEVERFDVFGNHLALKSVRWTNPIIPVVFDAQGELPVLRFVPRSEGPAAPAPAEPPSGSPFRVTAQSITLEGGTVPFTDRRFEPAFRKEVGPIAIGVSKFDNTTGDSGLELLIGAESGEHIKLNGKFALAPQVSASGTLAVKGVSVPAYAPYLKDVPAVIESAILGVGTDFSVALKPQAPVDLTTQNGWLELASVAVSKPDMRGAKVAWARLGLTGLSFTLATGQASATGFEILKVSAGLPRYTKDLPGQARLASLKLGEMKVVLDPLRVETKAFDLSRFSVREKAGVDLIVGFAGFGMRGVVYDAAARRVAIGGITLQAPEFKLTMEKSGGLNLARVLVGPPPPPPPGERDKEKKAAEEKEEAEAAATPAKVAPAAGPGMTLVLPRIALHQGNVKFVDQTLEPPFIFGMKDIEVDLRDFSTLTGTRASLTVKADAGAQGTLAIEGAASPNDGGLNPDVKLTISGTDLTTFSPYTLRFISHPVATGKLDLRVHLAVSDRKLSVENKVVINNFTLGEEKESPDDVGIPIGIALVLLRDSDNGIELEVPVSGNLDDPDFALGKVIWHAIVNVLTKIVTSPFTFLASLVGGGEDIDLIAMEPGRTQILADSAGKIDLLVKALKKRPGVRLAIAAITDPATDGEVLTRQRVELALKQQKSGEHEGGGTTPADAAGVAANPAERPRLVDLVARAAGWKAPEGVKLPPEAILKSQEEFLRKSLAAGPEQLRELGTARVEAIMKALQADPGIAPERLFVRQADKKDLEKASKIKGGVVIDIQ